MTDVKRCGRSRAKEKQALAALRKSSCKETPAAYSSSYSTSGEVALDSPLKYPPAERFSRRWSHSGHGCWIPAGLVGADSENWSSLMVTAWECSCCEDDEFTRNDSNRCDEPVGLRRKGREERGGRQCRAKRRREGVRGVNGVLRRTRNRVAPPISPAVHKPYGHLLRTQQSQWAGITKNSVWKNPSVWWRDEPPAPQYCFLRPQSKVNCRICPSNNYYCAKYPQTISLRSPALLS